jgi:hypothetical protein
MLTYLNSRAISPCAIGIALRKKTFLGDGGDNL